MRGYRENQQEDMFSYVSLEGTIPERHPLRQIREFVDGILDEMWADFDGLYSRRGRPGIPPEQLLKALLLQVLYTIRSEAQLVEQLNYNLLFRWFVGLGMSGRVWDKSTFSKNRERLMAGDIADVFFARVVELAAEKGLVSEEHFSVDGSLVEAWAGLKSFQLKEGKKSSRDNHNDDSGSPPSGNPDVDFHGEKRSNKTHESKTDSDSTLYRKGNGKEAKLSYMGHVLMENRNGLAVDARLNKPGYYSEEDATLEMAQGLEGKRKKTIGGDKNYDRQSLTDNLKEMGISSHAAQNIHPRRLTSSVDGRTSRHDGYQVSQRKRKRIEEIFGWLKTTGLMRRPMFRGMEKMDFVFAFNVAVYNLVRINNLCRA